MPPTARRPPPTTPPPHRQVYEVPLPPKHRFPMDKYRLVRQRLMRVLLPGRLATFEVSPIATQEDLNTVHCPDYVRRYMHGEFSAAENRRVGFPWSPSSVDRALSSVGGTVAAMHALGRGEATVAAHVAGGTHHAFRDRGEGFCVFSDIAVAAGVVSVGQGSRVARSARRASRGDARGVGVGGGRGSHWTWHVFSRPCLSSSSLASDSVMRPSSCCR